MTLRMHVACGVFITSRHGGYASCPVVMPKEGESVVGYCTAPHATYRNHNVHS